MPNIYMTINKFNYDKKIPPYLYIGSDQHDNDGYYGSSITLKHDIQELGKDNFEKIIIEYFDNIDNKQLRHIESMYLQIHDVKNNNIFYNKTDKYAPGGGVKGMKHSKKFDRTEKWLESKKGWVPSNYTRELWSEQRTGKKHSKETIQKMKSSHEGEQNHNALVWNITSPSGNVFNIKGLRKFCRDNNLSFGMIYNSRKGWRVEKIGSGKGGRPKK